MPITPDTKDWTWVLRELCPECGFDVRNFPREEVGDLIRKNARSWEPVLHHPRVRERPFDDRWSAIEYACHVRDVFRLYDERLELMLTDDDAHFENWDQDEAAVADDYASQEPERVLEELKDAAARLADRFDSVSGDAWERSGKRSDGAAFTTESFARYLIHDPVHHLYDADRGFIALASRH
jgi:DinB superfamily